MLSLFEGIGIEIEYMIVDSQDLSVRPLADRLMAEVGGGYDIEVELGPIAWSNELALHVIEFKTNGPVASLAGVSRLFQEHVNQAGEILGAMGAQLLPTGMHPWMNPETELRLWPHENNAIYETFDRIFGCRGHGWANLQSTHVNLPFANDEEFGRLHAAIRLVLPLLPALAASSPLMDGRWSGFLDSRLEVYRGNSRRIPSVTGFVVPEPVFTPEQYHRDILGRIYGDLAPFDPSGTLHHEWVNARGCIARFDRMAIEIRLLDAQECPAADLAIAHLIVETVRALVEERWCSFEQQKSWGEVALQEVLLAAIRDGDEAVVANRDFLRCYGCGPAAVSMRELWRHILEAIHQSGDLLAESRPALERIIEQGCLARRIRNRVGPTEQHSRVQAVYRELSECLRSGEMFPAGR